MGQAVGGCCLDSMSGICRRLDNILASHFTLEVPFPHRCDRAFGDFVYAGGGAHMENQAR